MAAQSADRPVKRLPPSVGTSSLLAGLALWTAAQATWLQADHRIAEGDVLTNTGALELFHQEAQRSSGLTVLARAWLEDFGEYPALVPAVQGWASSALGVVDLGGDGPALVGLGWMWLLVLCTAALGRRLGPGAGAWAGALLLLSPFVAGLGRHVLLELPMAALVLAAAAVGARAWGLGDEPVGATAGEAHGGGARWGTWAMCGALAGLALLAKQTAALTLVPLVLVAGRQWRGLALAAAVAGAVAGPWYLGRLGAEGEYLLRSAGANPDAVGALHQLAIYPLALVQLPWGPWGVAAIVAGGFWARRRPGSWGVLATAGLAMLPLLLLPKKYPRLLLPLLPLLALWLGAWMARWPRRAQGAVLALLLLGQGAAFVGALSPPMWGLTELDERCPQRWVRPPHPEGIDWSGIVAAIGAHGGEREATRVGAVEWPGPPCAHQTTLDLGEHLRIAARRGGLEALVLAGQSFEQAGGRWVGGPPELVLSEGPLQDCAGCGGLELVGAWPLSHPEWSSDLRLYRTRP